MRKYDSIVVGSGISGLTMAQLLGSTGHKVLLIECASKLGGSFARFYRKGIPFDTGFHFTGGFGKTRVLHDMLHVLGFDDEIEPIFLNGENSNRIFFEDTGKEFDIPPGFPAVLDQLVDYFPEEKEGINKFFKKAKEICDNTPMLDIRKLKDNNLPLFSLALKEDFKSLDEVLNSLIDNKYLKSILSLYCLCYGTKPEEVSFANHSRISLWLFESIARVEKGGDAFISAFKKQFNNINIDIRTGTYIEQFSDFSGKNANTAMLNTGEKVQFENCILAIHPREILKILPEQYLRKSFISRVNAFEESNGFFSIHAYLDEDYNGPFQPSLNSILSIPNLNKVLDPHDQEGSNLVVMSSYENVSGKKYKIINAFEQSFYENVKKFDKGKKRSKEYMVYKKERTEQIVDRILRQFPGYKNHLRVVESATMLTYKDYLHSPYGSAYGIKQKLGQFNLLGRLPLRNLFAVGQSALLPGLVGGMMSSFIVLKSIIGNDEFQKFIKNSLDN